MAAKKQCDMHDKEIDELRKDINEMKVNFNEIRGKIDSLFEKIKSPFTLKDKIYFVLGLIGYAVVISATFTTTERRSIDNEKRIDKIESKTDKIYDIVFEMNKKIK